MTKKSWFLAFAGVFSILSGNASAALVTLNGNGFNATYDTANLGLFGTPTLSGDGKTILFSPLGFNAISTGAQNTVTVTSSVLIDIVPDANFRLTSVSLTENGSYRMVDRAGNGPLAPSVDLFGELRLTNLDDGISSTSTNFSAGQLANTCAASNPCVLSSWTAFATANTPAAWGNADVRVLIQNTLTAESFYTGDSALIEKKQSSQSLAFTPFVEDVNPVPVPGAVWLFGSALAGLIGLRRNARA